MYMNIKRKFYFEGEEIILSSECKKRGLKYSLVYGRIKSGWTVERAFSAPIRRNGSFYYRGKKRSLKELCQINNWDYQFIANQVYGRKLTLKKAIKNLFQSKNLINRKTKILLHKTVSKDCSTETIDHLRVRLKNLRSEKEKLKRKFELNYSEIPQNERLLRREKKFYFQKKSQEMQKEVNELLDQIKQMRDV